MEIVTVTQAVLVMSTPATEHVTGHPEMVVAQPCPRTKQVTVRGLKVLVAALSPPG